MEKKIFDFWYAVNNTQILTMPSRHLDTFGSTILNYHLVTELMDSVGQIRIREGRIEAYKPRIITPEAYAETALEGFGDEAEKYVEWLKQHESQVRVLQYGYKLKQQEFSEHVVTDNMQSVIGRVKKEAEAKDDPLSAVVVGVDNPWDVCLVKLFWEVIQKSAQTNIQELASHKMFEDAGGIPRWVLEEVEEAFRAANSNPANIKRLAAKLQEHGLFERYQDRFFTLVKGPGQG